MANHVIAYLKPQICLEFLKPKSESFSQKLLQAVRTFQKSVWIQTRDQGLLGQLQDKRENSKQKGYLILLVRSPVIINNKAVDLQMLYFFLQMQHSNLLIDGFQDTTERK